MQDEGGDLNEKLMALSMLVEEISSWREAASKTLDEHGGSITTAKDMLSMIKEATVPDILERLDELKDRQDGLEEKQKEGEEERESLGRIVQAVVAAENALKQSLEDESSRVDALDAMLNMIKEVTLPQVDKRLEELGEKQEELVGSLRSQEEKRAEELAALEEKFKALREADEEVKKYLEEESAKTDVISTMLDMVKGTAIPEIEKRLEELEDKQGAGGADGDGQESSSSSSSSESDSEEIASLRETLEVLQKADEDLTKSLEEERSRSDAMSAMLDMIKEIALPGLEAELKEQEERQDGFDERLKDLEEGGGDQDVTELQDALKKLEEANTELQKSLEEESSRTDSVSAMLDMVKSDYVGREEFGERSSSVDKALEKLSEFKDAAMTSLDNVAAKAMEQEAKTEGIR